MKFRISLPLVAATVLASVMNYASAVEAGHPPPSRSCGKPQYPLEAARLNEEGITEIGFLIGTDGIVEKTVILNSSGSPRLDQAAQEVVSACVFKRPTSIDGRPMATWVPVAYNWFLSDKPGTDHPDTSRARAQVEASLRENGDDMHALYYYSLLKSSKGASAADLEDVWKLKMRAAERGHPFAQYIVGRRYEQGIGVAVDLDEAFRWYKKAAAQGEVFAIQRLGAGARVF